MKTTILGVSEPNPWGKHDHKGYRISHGSESNGVQGQMCGGDSYGRKRWGMCGLEWVAQRHEDPCPLAELETVLFPEGWFYN